MITKKSLIELPSFECRSDRLLPPNLRLSPIGVMVWSAFATRLILIGSNLFAVLSISQLLMASERGVNLAVNVAKPGESGFFFYDMFLWKRYHFFREFAFEFAGSGSCPKDHAIQLR